MTAARPLATRSEAHLRDLETWLETLEPLDLEAELSAGLKPEEVAVVCVDLIEGFTRLGPLASPRVTAIIENVVALLGRAEALGVTNVAFVQDAHPEDAEEFEAYPVHCVKGTDEALAVRELEALPNWARYEHLEKNSISALESTGLESWLAARPGLKLILAVGDVTDLCLYSLALGLKLRSIARGLGQRVVVPENCTQTWDAPDHPGDLYHAMFLFQMRRNGVQIASVVR
jgi:nicotinamidase-related amidase